MRTFRLISSLCFACCLVLAADHHDWKKLRQQIRETLHVPQKLPKLEEKRYGDFSPAPDIVADRVSYATGYNLRVPAIVYHPAQPKRKRGPALIIVNGHGGDKSSWYAYWAGILYARAGAVVLTYDPIGEFERNHLRESGSTQHDAYLPPDDMGRRLGGLMVEDIMQAVSYLFHRKDVDKGRIAVLGYSMGSFISVLECAIDTRVHACVLVGGGDLDGPGGYWDSSKKMCQAIPSQSLRFLGDRGAMIYALNAKRGPALVWNGTADQVVDIPHHNQGFFTQLQERAIAEAGSRKNMFDFGFTPDGGHRPYFLTKPVALWLEDKLNFPNWTKDQIGTMPETRIAEWAARNHNNSSNLKNERGEGGMTALGNDIPAVNRDLLHSLPDSVWNTQRDRYLYETWVAHAEAAIRSGANEAQ